MAFHHDDSGLAALKVKAKGHRDPISFGGALTSVRGNSGRVIFAFG